MQARVLISGFVQGIGFRHFIKSKAQELRLKGFVGNLPDGKVEAVFQGSKENIQKIISFCRKGPFLSNVENMEVKWEKTIDKSDDFVIR